MIRILSYIFLFSFLFQTLHSKEIKIKEKRITNYVDTNYQITVRSGQSITYILLKYNHTYEAKKLAETTSGKLSKKNYDFILNSFETALKLPTENINECRNGYAEISKIQKKDSIKKTYCILSKSDLKKAGDRLLEMGLLL
jgi:hypothetical protein